MKQTAFTTLAPRPYDVFGGSLLKSNPKTARPLDSKLPIHLVLRANQGGMRRPAVYGKIHKALYAISKKHGVKIYRETNVGNHLHLLIKISRRPRWAAYIRELTGQLAQIAQGLKAKQKASQKFWRYRPFTRIVRGWNKAFRIAKDYIELNRLEAQGFIKRSEIKTLKDLRALLEPS